MDAVACLASGNERNTEREGMIECNEGNKEQEDKKRQYKRYHCDNGVGISLTSSGLNTGCAVRGSGCGVYLRKREPRPKVQHRVKGSYPVWDDFISKASKLQSQLRTTVVAVAAFLDAFQKVADLATNSR
ncbi:metastasis suppressor protein 1-like protein, partial [Lates japonicus]